MNQLPLEILGQIFEFLEFEQLYSLLRMYPGVLSSCCANIRWKLMLYYIERLRLDDAHVPKYKRKRKKAFGTKRKHFKRGEEFNDRGTIYTANQTMMIYYPKMSLKVLFEKVHPYLKDRVTVRDCDGLKDGEMSKLFHYHFYKIVLSLKLFKSSSQSYNCFNHDLLEDCMRISKMIGSRRKRLNEIVATGYLTSLKYTFYEQYLDWVKKKKQIIPLLELWNEKFKFTDLVLSDSKIVHPSKKVIAHIITSIWNEYDKLLDLMPLIRSLDKTASNLRTKASVILLEIMPPSSGDNPPSFSPEKQLNMNTHQDVQRLQNLLECCMQFKYHESEFSTLLLQFLRNITVSPQVQETFNALSNRVLSKFKLNM